MKGTILITVTLLSTQFAFAQNEIDYVNSLYWSGYGKMAIDGDTLYLNSLNGHGVERYDISNPANPTFIDREHVSGFDQIDFGRRLMAKLDSTTLILADFSQFESVNVASCIPIRPQAQSIWHSWKLSGNRIFAVFESDSVRTYDISDISAPRLSAIGGLYRESSPQYYNNIAFGGTIFVIANRANDGSSVEYLDIYDIRIPDSVRFIHSQTIPLGGISQYILYEANGDTLASVSGSGLFGATFQLTQYFPIDSVQLILNDYGYWPNYYTGKNGYVKYEREADQNRAYSYSDLSILGTLALPEIYAPENFEMVNDQFVLNDQSNFLKIYQATHSIDPMPMVDSTGPAHYGIRSVASYGNYVLSGAESNGGELLVQELGQNGEISLVSTVPGVNAKNIIIDGVFAICLCPDKISVVSLADPVNPVIRSERNDFIGELLDFALYDTILYAITDEYYIVIDYDPDQLNVLTYVGTSNFNPTSIDQYHRTSFLLDGIRGRLIKMDASNPSNPLPVGEIQLRPDTFTNVEVMYASAWASGRHGTDVFDVYTLDSVAFFGPEYFSDVRELRAISDTLFVSDGINGLKVFSVEFQPNAVLSFIGGYGTGNEINQVARISDNFFASDYYSLQHLRWGAPTGIEEKDDGTLPEKHLLSQNYPNPFNSSTVIHYSLPPESKADLIITDILGREIRRLAANGREGRIVWDGANSAGTPVSSGVYFYSIVGRPHTAKRMILLR